MSGALSDEQVDTACKMVATMLDGSVSGKPSLIPLWGPAGWVHREGAYAGPTGLVANVARRTAALRMNSDQRMGVW